MKWVIRIGVGLLILILVLAGLGFAVVTHWTRAPLPQLDGATTAPGLAAPVTIIRDEWGVPHVYAATTADLRFAQGYVHAQDRWWQMEFARHVARGAIQELTGRNDELLGDDIFIRTAGWRRTAEQELVQLPPDLLAELQAFSDGVNAYLAERSPGQLALEYRILGLIGVDIAVEPWTPLDSLSTAKLIAWDLNASARREELQRSAMFEALGTELTDSYFAEFPYGSKPTHIFADELTEAGYRQADAMPAPMADPPEDAGIAGLTMAMAGSIGHKDSFWLGKGEGVGSNAWAVSGAFTASGAPLLANDPHLGVQLPSIWYEIGLHCEPVGPDCPYRTRGFAYTGLPGIIMGVNDEIAWGVTSFSPDAIDFYRLEINPDNALQYRWNDAWRDFTVHEETIHFGDGGSLALQVRETHFGPVMTDNQLVDPDAGEVSGFVNEDALAMRWTGWEPSTTVQAILLLNRASDWAEFRDAAAYLDAPAMNLVYADRAGNIGFQPTGRFPVRAGGHTGLLPVDGTRDAFAWRGYIPFEYLPRLYNPNRGFLTIANQALTPLAYYDDLAAALADDFGPDAYYRFRTEWAQGYRGERLLELFAEEDEHSTATMQAMHGDNRQIVAAEIAPFLAAVDLGEAERNATRDWLLDWDYQMHMESAQAALFGVFWRQLVFDLFADQLGDVAKPDGGVNNMLTVIELLEEPDHLWWDDVATEAIERRDAILVGAFNTALDDLRAQHGADREAWRWGDLHVINFTAVPLGASGVGPIEWLVNLPSVSVSGGAATVNATRWDYEDDTPYAARTIPGQRMIIDLDDYANNLAINSTGQSGHAASPHYDDMTATWRAIGYHPMLWAQDKVEAAAKHTLTLLPNE